MLKSKENEYMRVREDMMAKIKAKEKELSTALFSHKSLQKQCNILKQKQFNNDANVLGFDRINALVYQLREATKLNHELMTEVKSMSRINNDQNKELERIDDTKNYPGKIKALL